MSKKRNVAIITIAVALYAAGGVLGDEYTGDPTYKSVAAANITGLYLEEGPEITVTIPRAKAKRVLKVTATLRIDPYCFACSATDTDAWLTARVGAVSLFPTAFQTLCKLDRTCTLTAIWWEDVDTMLADGRATKNAPLPIVIHAQGADEGAGIFADGQLSVFAELVKK